MNREPDRQTERERERDICRSQDEPVAATGISAKSRVRENFLLVLVRMVSRQRRTTVASARQQLHRTPLIVLSSMALLGFIGPIPWGHSGPLCHTLSSLLLLLS